MIYKIAAASSDGKIIDRHFGKADKFYIYAADDDTYTFMLIDERTTEPVCQGGGHDDSAMERSVDNLSDCEYVLVSQIGTRARNECERKGLTVFEIPDEIEKAIVKLMKYEQVQRLIVDAASAE